MELNLDGVLGITHNSSPLPEEGAHSDRDWVPFDGQISMVAAKHMNQTLQPNSHADNTTFAKCLGSGASFAGDLDLQGLFYPQPDFDAANINENLVKCASALTHLLQASDINEASFMENSSAYSLTDFSSTWVSENADTFGSGETPLLFPAYSSPLGTCVYSPILVLKAVLTRWRRHRIPRVKIKKGPGGQRSPSSCLAPALTLWRALPVWLEQVEKLKKTLLQNGCTVARSSLTSGMSDGICDCSTYSGPNRKRRQSTFINIVEDIYEAKARAADREKRIAALEAENEKLKRDSIARGSFVV
ncbi:uncharacterized protein BDV17DRAFT_296121 [Aspergillus undulatus]|uniref:uncharacterized protein n=1 Tax=Aspergillus undulatus TaxID=1810928 RepID=UPI003CCCE3C3